MLCLLRLPILIGTHYQGHGFLESKFLNSQDLFKGNFKKCCLRRGQCGAGHRSPWEKKEDSAKTHGAKWGFLANYLQAVRNY